MEVVQIRITNSTCKRMIRTKSGVQLVSYCSFTCYRTQSDVLFGKTLIVGMPRLTEVERGQAISQLMQGHTRCRAIWCECSDHRASCDAFTGYRKGYRPSPVCTNTCNATTRGPSNHICAIVSLGHQNCSQHHRHPQNCKESAERCQSRCASSLRWSPFDTITSTMSDELAVCTSTGNIPRDALEVCTVHWLIKVHTFLVEMGDVAWSALEVRDVPTPALMRGIDLGVARQREASCCKSV